MLTTRSKLLQPLHHLRPPNLKSAPDESPPDDANTTAVQQLDPAVATTDTATADAATAATSTDDDDGVASVAALQNGANVTPHADPNAMQLDHDEAVVGVFVVKDVPVGYGRKG